MNKVIVLDYSVFLHKAMYASLNNPQVPATYTALSMIIGNLFRIGIDEEDLIIIAVDGRNSWRKSFEKEYKANREEKRKESGLNWDKAWYDFADLLERLDMSTNWQIVGNIEHIEADDIMAVSCRYFKDKEVILVTNDSDLEQMWYLNNVKIFSPQTKKWKLKPENFNVHKLIAKKINKETADNLISPILTEDDYTRRKLCVDLTSLPDWVENSILEKLNNLIPKIYDKTLMPFNNIRERYLKLNNDKTKIINYNDQFIKTEKKKAKKKVSRTKKGK